MALESGLVCHLRFYLLFQGDLLAPFRACSGGAAILDTTQSGPQHTFGSGLLDPPEVFGPKPFRKNNEISAELQRERQVFFPDLEHERT